MKISMVALYNVICYGRKSADTLALCLQHDYCETWSDSHANRDAVFNLYQDGSHADSYF
jgi:hypothetical protein